MINKDGGSIIFIVRASVRDGLGHLMRSLFIFTELIKKTDAFFFLLGDGSGHHLIENAAIQYHHYLSDEECAGSVSHLNPSVVVFDTLHFEANAFRCIKSMATIVSISPEFSEIEEVDFLFHRTAIANPLWKNRERFPVIYKGLEYTVLPPGLKRMAYEYYKESLQDSRLSVAISMGGADAPNRTLDLLRLFGESPSQFILWVALGDAYTHSYEELLNCAARNRQEIVLLKSNDSMWRVLKNASIVICAGGLTTYEAAFIGLPSINIIQQPTWFFLFNELEQKGVCQTICPSKGALEQAVNCAVKMDLNRDLLMKMHMASKDVIPSGGAERIATQLLSINQSI